ncbi:MAG: amidohydrolase family protein, partial [Pseudomonadota bacterium]
MAQDAMAQKGLRIASMAMRNDWLAQVSEAPIDPEREIVDPHHHLWDRNGVVYELDELWADTGCGHNVTQTVYIECHSAFRTDGPEHLRPVGETEYVAAMARTSAAASGRATIAGIVGHADLRSPHLDEILDAHEAAGEGLFRGIRHALASARQPEVMAIPGRAPAGLGADEEFRRGVARLGERGLTYDTWHFHYQNPEFLELAKVVPGTTMVLDHFGTPVGVGPYAGKRDDVFAQWKDDVSAIAECPNVVAKLGGMAMPDNGYGWHERERPPTSDEFVDAQAPWYHHMIQCFGPDRCMFESNFPVDRISIGYGVLWNGLKKIAAGHNYACCGDSTYLLAPFRGVLSEQNDDG